MIYEHETFSIYEQDEKTLVFKWKLSLDQTVQFTIGKDSLGDPYCFQRAFAALVSLLEV